MQLALDGGDNPEAKENALQTQMSATAAILNNREIPGKAQYVKFTFLLGTIPMVIAQHNLFKGSGYFWLGAQTGLLGAILPTAIGIRCRAVALDIGIAGKLSDSALRLLIGAISGGTIVLLFATGLLPSLHTGQGEQDGVHAMAFVMLLGIVAGFVEQLVPSLLENQADRFRNGDDAKKATATPGRGGDKTERRPNRVCSRSGIPP